MSKNTEWITCPNGCGARLYFREVSPPCLSMRSGMSLTDMGYAATR